MTYSNATRSSSEGERVARLQATLTEIQNLLVRAKMESAEASDVLLSDEIDGRLRKALKNVTDAQFHVW
jgi:hypothetical protein